VSHGIARANSSGHIGGGIAVLALLTTEPVNDRDAIRRRVGLAINAVVGVLLLFLTNLVVFPDPHEHHHATHLCDRWDSRMVDHRGTLSAIGSFLLRSRVTGLIQGLFERFLIGYSLH
jgi:hypothetical protein